MSIDGPEMFLNESLLPINNNQTYVSRESDYKFMYIMKICESRVDLLQKIKKKPLKEMFSRF